MNLPDNNPSSASARLDLARLKQWHQQGEALLTIENARSFLNATGLVLFVPRPQIAAPAPSFVEAVLGERCATPTLAQIAQARELLARLVAEGLAVPLNLLGLGSVIGQSSDAPDFIVSAQVFSYVFTMRGDKGWKQPPQPTGVGKFSNLAIATHEALTQRGPMTASDLTQDVGKEVTEAAVLRALGELWAHLRVLPMPQLDGRPTVWELANTRLIKQIKAGANAGLPTALSVLISLYLGQAIVATEDEIESFLSPLAARSRVRDVLHALLAAQQLTTVAIEGRTVLHVAGTVPAFLTEETQAAPDAQQELNATLAAAGEAEAGIAAVEGEERGTLESAEPGSRIAKFTPRRKPAAGDLAKARPTQFARKPFGEKKPFARSDGKGRPPTRDGKSARPFSESRGFKPRGIAGSVGSDRGERRPRPSGGDKPRFEKKSFGPRASESKPRFERRSEGTSRPEQERRPFVRKEDGDRGPARKPFERPKREFDSAKPRSFGSSRTFGDRSKRDDGGEAKGRSGGFGAKRPFSKPGGLGKPFRSDARPSRAGFGDKKFGSAKPKSFGSSRTFGDRPKRDDGGEEKSRPRPGGFGAKKPLAKPGGLGKPFRSDARPARAGFGDKKFGSAKPRSFGSSRTFGDRPKRDDGGEEKSRPRPGGFGAKRPFAKPGGLGKPFRSDARPARAGFGDKKFGSPKPGGARFGDKKFGGKKPFGDPKSGRAPKRPSQSQGDQEA